MRPFISTVLGDRGLPEDVHCLLLEKVTKVAAVDRQDLADDVTDLSIPREAQKESGIK